jgi:hypothetical protein
VHELIDLVIAAPADEKLRERWLERMGTAVEDDGVDSLWEVSERSGELCGSPERASQAADGFLPPVRLSWQERGAYFRGTPACLGCLLVAERFDELLALIDTAPYLSWSYRRFGVRALAAMGRSDEAIEYAQSSLGLNDSPAAIARACEEILVEVGRSDEAYDRFALEANRAGTHLATCRALIKKYPDKEPRAILGDLITSTPDDEGRFDRDLPAVHSTDTHGTNHGNFALLHWFGYRFAPRYRRIRSKVETALVGFHRPTHYDKDWPIKPRRRVREGLIVSEWPNIERILLSLALKSTTQSVIVGKLSSYRCENRTKRALGRSTASSAPSTCAAGLGNLFAVVSAAA